MKKIATKWKCFGLLLTLAFVLCLSGGLREVSADSTTCRVIFANSKGNYSSGSYRKWTRSVKTGTTVELPKVTRKGYEARWVTEINGKQRRYLPGQSVTIRQNTKFCLNLYKLYTVSFYTANGKKEYKNLRQTVVAGGRIKMPVGSSNTTYQFQGWSTKAGGAVQYKSGASVRVRGNIKVYSVLKKLSGTILCKNNGTVWKTVSVSGTEKFPEVAMINGDMCLGWSKTKGKSTLSASDFKAGDKIPTGNKIYYMVVYKSAMDKAPSSLTTASSYDRIYFVGDSRMVDTKRALGGSVPSNVQFVAKGQQGLSWFKSTGYRELLQAVSKRPRTTRKAVVVNLGVNDLSNVDAYITYMSAVAKNLKRYNCKMYYLSVNPVNTAMIQRVGASYRTQAQVTLFNAKIYRNLCYGRNKTFTYINTCTNLQTKGWISNRYNAGIHDGLHYSNATYLKIFDYCMRVLNR